MSNKTLIWINIILFLVLSLLLFEIKDRQIDPTFKHFGMREKDVLQKYGDPDFMESIGGPGGIILFYGKENLSFVMAGDEGVVNTIEAYPGKSFLGIRVGMTFDEIKNILSDPDEEGYDPYDDNYTMLYKLEEGKIEIWFTAEEEGGSTKKAQIIWKEYWW